MRHIKASEFKAKCLKLLDEVRDTGERLTVTKNGIPIAQVRPIKRPAKRKSLFGIGKGEIEILGDIVNPIPGIWNFDRHERIEAAMLERTKKTRTKPRKAEGK